ncbi:hypothetical protein AB4144_03755, partial [Rhizobiaceae sp. 2RAB30]
MTAHLQRAARPGAHEDKSVVPEPPGIGIAALVPETARQHVVPYALLVVLAAVSRAAAAVLLVPLLGALFTSGVSAALPWLAALAVAIAVGWLSESRLILRAF